MLNRLRNEIRTLHDFWKEPRKNMNFTEKEPFFSHTCENFKTVLQFAKKISKTFEHSAKIFERVFGIRNKNYLDSYVINCSSWIKISFDKISITDTQFS